MYYRDNLAFVEAFAKGLATRYPNSDTLIVSKSSLPPTTEVIVLRPQRGRE